MRVKNTQCPIPRNSGVHFDDELEGILDGDVITYLR